jgi:hypothetical protein
VWLLSQQDYDGSFGSRTGENRLLATSEALQAMRALGLGNSMQARAAETYLSLESPTELDFVARRVIALQDGPMRDEPTRLLLRDLLLSAAADATAQLGLAPGFSLSTVEMSLTMRAVVPAGTDRTQVLALQSAGDALLLRGRLQRGYELADEAPDSFTTAQAIEALTPMRFLPEFPGLLDGWIVAQILAKQSAAGDFGGGDQPVLDTAQCLLALTELDQSRFTQNLAGAVSGGASFLAGAQGADGSWGGNIYMTALTLRALAVQRPNWSVSLDESGRSFIAFSNPNPIRGETVSARLALANRSTAAAPSTTLRFQAIPESGGPAVFLAEVSLGALQPGQRTEAVGSFSTSALSGRYTVTAAVDPENAVAETVESDNTASGVLNVVRAVNLAVNATDITFAAVSAGQVRISVSVHNVGEAVGAFQVAFYKGNPATGGLLIGAKSASGMAEQSTTSVSQDWATAGVNGPTPIYAVVDSGKQIDEANEQDNSSFRFYFPGAGLPVDLSIDFNDVTSSPQYPLRNKRFDLLAQIHNLSANDAQRVAVVVTGLSDGLVRAVIEVPLIPAGATVTARIPMVLGAGVTVRVTIDPDDALNDTYRNNNGIHHTVSIVDQSEYSVAMTGLSINGNPGLQQLVGTAQNLGSKTVDTFIAFYRGDPRVGGAEQTDLIPVHLVAGGYAASAKVQVDARMNDLFSACVDPDHQIEDDNRNDDCITYSFSPVSAHLKPDLAISERDVLITPVGPDVGELFSVAATLMNKSAIPAQCVARLWQGQPTASGSAILGQKTLSVQGNGSESVSWTAIRGEGDTNLYVSIDDVQPGDADPTNNIASRNLFLKAFVDSGRSPASMLISTTAAVGDIFNSGKPVMVFGEQEGPLNAWQQNNRITAMQVDADGHATQLWSQVLLVSSNTQVLSPTLVDLDNDGVPEIVTATVGCNSVADGIAVYALTPTGAVKWRTDYVPSALGGCNQYSNSIALGDLNGDGFPDVVLTGADVVALSGLDGSILFNVPAFPGIGPGGDMAATQVLDLNDDGRPEVLISRTGANTRLLSGAGVQLWRTTAGADDIAVLDLDLDGFPEIIVPEDSGLVVLDARTGATLYRLTTMRPWDTVIGSSLMQDGLAYVGSSNNAYDTSIAAFRPFGGALWFSTLEPIYIDHPVILGLADLLGRGRPQVIAQSPSRLLSMLDGRTGEVLFDPKIYVDMGHEEPRPVVADVDGDGRGEVVVMYSPATVSSVQPRYAFANQLVFGSEHWKKMPTVWNSRTYVHGQVDEHLHFLHDYQPWKTHNTWMQQFDEEPARLLPDFEVVAKEISCGPVTPLSGGSATLTAVIHNVGGVPAANVEVRFYDGDPDHGGQLIASTTAAGPLTVRGGTGTVSASWTPYPDGEHQIYVSVNPSKAIEESGYERNVAHARVFVELGANLSDVFVSAAEMSVAPTAPMAGTRATVSAVVHNLGVRDSGVFAVAFWDGVPGQGATYLGSDPVATLAQGSAATASLDVVFGPGSHYLYAIADPDQVTFDGDRSNNTAFVTITSPASNQPDLAILAKDPAVSPNPALQGRAVTVSAVVRNYGTETNSPVVRFYLGDPDLGGVAFGEQVLRGVLIPGQTKTATATLSTAALLGPQIVFVRADPDKLIADSSRLNNTASLPFTVIKVDATVLVITDAQTYSANSAVAVSVVLANQASIARSLSLEVAVEREDGSQVASLVSGQEVVVGPGATKSFTLPWATSTTPAGTYRVHATLKDGSGVLGQASSAIAILSDAHLFAQVTADKASYLPGEQALIRQYLRNESANASTGPLTSVVSVGSAGSVLRTTRHLSPLTVGASYTNLDLVQVGSSLAPGTYPVALTVTDDKGALVATMTTGLIVGAPTPAQALAAQLIASPAEYWPGQFVVFAAHLTNRGNVALKDEGLTIRILNAETLEAEALAASTTSLEPGTSTTVAIPWASAMTMTTGDKVAALEVQGKVIARVLLRAIHHVDSDPPTVTLGGVSDGLVTNAAVTAVVTVSDASEFTWVATFDGASFTPGTTVSAEGDHLLSVSASDVFGNKTSVEAHFSIDRAAPVIAVAGITQGACSNADVRPTLTVADEHPGTTTVTLDGAPWTPTMIGSEGSHSLSVVATDAAGNEARSLISFSIDKTPPSLMLVGFKDGSTVNGMVIPSARSSDADVASLSATLNGQPLVLGTAVSTAGQYLVEATAVDRCGNSSSKSGRFTLEHGVDSLVGIAPIVECVSEMDGGYTALFGYQNENAFTVEIPIGERNGFAPEPVNRGQPTTFEPGHLAPAFEVAFDGQTLAWSLNGETAAASSTSTRCSAESPDAGQADGPAGGAPPGGCGCGAGGPPVFSVFVFAVLAVRFLRKERHV